MSQASGASLHIVVELSPTKIARISRWIADKPRAEFLQEGVRCSGAGVDDRYRLITSCSRSISRDIQSSVTVPIQCVEMDNIKGVLVEFWIGGLPTLMAMSSRSEFVRQRWFALICLDEKAAAMSVSIRMQLSQWKRVVDEAE